MKKFILDRIEEDKAVLECENGDIAVFERKVLPKNINEGDVLYFENGSCFLNEEETTARKKRISKLMESLFQ